MNRWPLQHLRTCRSTVSESTNLKQIHRGGLSPVTHLSHAQKKTALLSMKYWFFNRDPYFMVYHNPHITGQYNPHNKSPKQQNGALAFHCGHLFSAIYRGPIYFTGPTHWAHQTLRLYSHSHLHARVQSP